jgi:nitroreductase
MNLWRKLLETAIHSPSPHNVQPWRVRILSDYEADLLIDSQRTLPKEDPTGSFIILTMGLFIEGLTILAAGEGFSLRHEMSHEPSWYAPSILATKAHTFLPFARLRLVSDDGAKSEFDPLLFLARRTSRVSLLPAPVPDSAKQTLTELAGQWNQSYSQVSEPDQIDRILDENTSALFEDLNNPDYHDEIVAWFRFTDRASRRHRDGLDYRCMNSSRSAYWLVARFPRLLQIRLTRPLMWRQYRSQLGLVPTIGILAGKFWDAAAAIETGRFLMRFWLETARQGLYIHPYGNLVTNHDAARWLQEETGIPDIWLVFKIGYSKKPPKSYRRSPILFVFGRADLTVPFYGAKIYPTDIEEIINADQTLVSQINSFQLSSYEDEQLNRHLRIHLETVKDFRGSLLSGDALRDVFFDGLVRCNQDFREVTRMFERSCVEVEINAFETGPFCGRDIRVKNKYIGTA